MPKTKLVNGLEINYEFHLGDTSYVLVFLHGLGANLTIWKKEFDYFKHKNYSVLMMDLRCHGGSSCKKNSRFRNFRTDLNSLIKKLKLKKLILIGHSLGGMIALDYYGKYPKNIKSIISIDSSYEISLRTLNPFTPFQILLRKAIGIFGSGKNNISSFINFQQFKDKSDSELIFEADTSMETFLDTNDIIHDLFNLNFSKTLGKIKIPVLVVASTDDQYFRVNVTKEMAEMIPDGYFQKIKGTHSIILKHPIKISHVIESFLEKHKLIK